MSEDKNITLAKVAEQAERYDDMADYMKEYMKSENAKVHEAEYRNLLSVAFKNVVGAKRSSWRILKAQQEGKDESPVTSNYIEKVVKELKEVCRTVLVRKHKKDLSGLVTTLQLKVHTMQAMSFFRCVHKLKNTLLEPCN